MVGRDDGAGGGTARNDDRDHQPDRKVAVACALSRHVRHDGTLCTRLQDIDETT